MNPGLSCHAANHRTFRLMQDMQSYFNTSIVEKRWGWGQVAYMKHFCDAGFYIDKSTSSAGNFTWHGVMSKFGINVSLFNAFTGNETITPEERNAVPAYHIKGCHSTGNILDRIACKENILKEQGQWFLPSDFPKDLAGWRGMSQKRVNEIKAFLFHEHSNR